MAKVNEVMSRQAVSIAASNSCLSAVERIRRSRVGHLPDLMTTDVGLDETLVEAARPMLERKVGSLPVLEDDRVVGILTETDMLRLIVRFDACTPECAEVIVSFPW
jgi:CBS domain-containing protein